MSKSARCPYVPKEPHFKVFYRGFEDFYAIIVLCIRSISPCFTTIWLFYDLFYEYLKTLIQAEGDYRQPSSYYMRCISVGSLAEGTFHSKLKTSAKVEHSHNQVADRMFLLKNCVRRNGACSDHHPATPHQTRYDFSTRADNIVHSLNSFPGGLL